MRCLIKTVVCALIFVTISSILAQDENMLSYGESATGEITNRHFEVEYVFAAEEGDVVVVTMVPDDTSEFRTPGILLLNEDYDVVGEAFNSYSVTLFHDVTKSGSYYILATRNDGRSGEGVGEFTLALNKALLLKNGQDLCESTTSEVDKHYAVRADGDFNVSYRFIEGDFRPEVSINKIKSRGSGLESMISLTGPSLERGSIGVPILSESLQLLIVRVGQRSYDWSDDKTARFALRLETGEPAEVIEMSLVAKSTINVRSGPGTDFEIVGRFESGGQEKAIARDEGGTWLRIGEGWVFAELVEPCGDALSLLPVASE